MTRAAVNRCAGEPGCPGGAPDCHLDYCPGMRRRREEAARDPLGYLQGIAARYAREHPAANADTFIVAMACRFTPKEERAIRDGFANVRDVSNNG